MYLQVQEIKDAIGCLPRIIPKCRFHPFTPGHNTYYFKGRNVQKLIDYIGKASISPKTKLDCRRYVKFFPEPTGNRCGHLIQIWPETIAEKMILEKHLRSNTEFTKGPYLAIVQISLSSEMPYLPKCLLQTFGSISQIKWRNIE